MKKYVVYLTVTEVSKVIVEAPNEELAEKEVQSVWSRSEELYNRFRPEIDHASVEVAGERESDARLTFTMEELKKFVPDWREGWEPWNA